jgi:hypothetical protein
MLAGLVAESHGLADRHCQARYLRNLATGARFSIFHDPGPGATMCHLDGTGAVAAAAGVESDIAALLRIACLRPVALGNPAQQPRTTFSAA